ncbi:MAG: histidine triad nucleotide-binding protein [Planctomycetota bacterium]
MAYDPNNVFARILRREIPAQFLHEDEHCVAFRDGTPQAPSHVLVIPRRPIASLAEANASDAGLLGHLMVTAASLGKQLGADQGFRLVINSGAGAGQSVFHLHIHVMAGRPFGWPPG